MLHQTGERLLRSTGMGDYCKVFWPVRLPMISPSFFGPGLLPTLWLLIYVVATAVTRLLVGFVKPISLAFTLLDTDKPFNSIGFVAAVLVTISWVGIVLVLVDLRPIKRKSNRAGLPSHRGNGRAARWQRALKSAIACSRVYGRTVYFRSPCTRFSRSSSGSTSPPLQRSARVSTAPS